MFTLSPDLEKAAIKAAAAMVDNVVAMPDCGGMKLVKLETPDFEERYKDIGVVMLPVTINGTRYCVCSR